MPIDVLMPQLGETVTEGKITVWHKLVGDRISHGDVLFEIESDKAVMEVPAITSGTLTRIAVAAGETAPIGAVVAVLDGEAQTAKSAAASAANGAPPAQSSAAPATRTGAEPLDPFHAVRTPTRNYGKAKLASGVKSTPRARRLAVTGGVDISGIRGSGPHGVITAADIDKAARGGSASPAATAAPPAAATRFSESRSLQQLHALYANTRHVQQPLDGVRRTIARRLSESKQTIPHFYLTADIDMEQALELRRQLNALQPQGKVSVNDLIVKAYALALLRVPQANVLWAEEALLQFSQVDLGIAVAVGEALFTPVIRQADSKPLAAISAEIKTLSEQARNAKLKPADYEGGTATISNLGMFGVREFSAILNPPQATILAVGALERRATEGASGAVVFRSLMSVTLSCDHRAVGGATGARLLQELKTILQSPLQLVL